HIAGGRFLQIGPCADAVSSHYPQLSHAACRTRPHRLGFPSMGPILLLLLAAHLYFLYKVWVDVSMFWALVCLVIPIVCLYIYWREWHTLRTVFFLARLLNIPSLSTGHAP